jgi:Tol biopolymer transport system component
LNRRRRRRAISSRASALILATLGLGSCKDAQEPFVPPELPPLSGDLVQLTLSDGDDRAPAWSADGDTIYYGAESFPPFPASPSVLLAVGREGGVARLLFEEIQTEPGIPRNLTAPSVAAGSNRIGFVQILPFNDPDVCPLDEQLAVECVPATAEPSPRPILDRVVLRVRNPHVRGPIASTPRLFVDFEGSYFDDTLPPIGPRPISVAKGVWVVDVHPFHTAFEREGVLIFRGSLSPDGSRMAFSDGLGLRIWNPDTGAMRAIPGTDDGVAAAWSPDGKWIAFTRYERGPASSRTCEHYAVADDVVFCLQQRTSWPLERRVLSIVRPDGSELRELGDGEDPAWTPDSGALFFRRNDQLNRIDVDGGVAQPVSGTAGGREPAVSPDGSEIAFARRAANGKHDIWRLTLEAQE